MGKVALHMTKIKAGGVRGIQSHVNREHPPKTNPDIDPSRTQDNYDILYSDNFHKDVRNAIELFAPETKTVRKDAVVMCSFIVTSDEQTMKAMSPETQRAFFEDATMWFCKRYGAGCVVNATVHLDETTPHMHLGVVPISNDRLSAKALFGPKELRAIQTDFARDVGAKYGLERGQEGSKAKHLDEVTYKLKKREERLEKASDGLQKASERLQELREGLGNLQAMKAEKTALEGEIEAMKDELAVLDRAAKEKSAQGAARFGGAEWEHRIADAREQDRKDRRLSLLERFVALPQIAPLWEQFCAVMDKARGKSRNRREKER